MRRLIVCMLCICLLFSSVSCGQADGEKTEEKDTNISPELTYSHSMETVYAKKFSVDYYQDGYALIGIADGSRFLVVPEGKKAPEKLEEGIVVLQQPIENIYLVASAVMDMFVSLDALDTVRFSGLKQDSWYIEEAKAAMEAGENMAKSLTGVVQRHIIARPTGDTEKMLKLSAFDKS